MKAGPRQNEFEPTEGKIVKFSDVHGVDEGKGGMSYHFLRLILDGSVDRNYKTLSPS